MFGVALPEGTDPAMDRAELGDTALVGWREKVADRAADPLAARTKLSTEDARALLGAAFFALSLYYVAGTVARAVRRSRG